MEMTMWMEHLELLHCLQECQKSQLFWGNVWQFLTNLLYDAEIVFLGNHPREMKTCPHGTRLSIAASSSGKWMNKVWHIHTMD